MIETRLTEIKYTTSDPKKMINKYTVNRVLKSWTEDFRDEDTGEVVKIERNEVLFERGTLIDQDVLSTIRFYMECGDIKEVEVSNQRRVAMELENTSLRAFMAVADIDRKKTKFLFYATKIATALLLLKDYIELNYMSGFFLSQIKEFDTNIILIDTLKKMHEDEDGLDSEDDEEESKDRKKFYQIDFNVEADGEQIYTASATVQTFNVDRGMMIITDYLIKNERKHKEEEEKAKREYKERVLKPIIEKVSPIPIGIFIPKEFSLAYKE